MSEWTLQRLLGALRPLNMDAKGPNLLVLTVHCAFTFAESESGIVFPRSTSGVEAVLEGNLPLTPLTSVDIGVRASARWLEHNGRFLFKLRRGIFTGA